MSAEHEGPAAAADLAHTVAEIEERLTRWLRAVEAEQFQLTSEMHLVRNAVEVANNGLDTLEDGLADISWQFSALYAQQHDNIMAPVGGAVSAGAASPAPALTEAAPALLADERGKREPPSLAVLHAWVEQQIAPLIRKTTTTGEGGGIRWCRIWWRHHDALDRFTALYWAHGELAASGEPTWLSVYLRDHLDPHLATLTSPYGPFYACTPSRHSDATAALGHDANPGKTHD